MLTRPVGRPRQKPVFWYKGFLYQAASWMMARASSSEGGVPLRGAVSASGLYRHKAEPARSSGGAETSQPPQLLRAVKLPQIAILDCLLLDRNTRQLYLGRRDQAVFFFSVQELNDKFVARTLVDGQRWGICYLGFCSDALGRRRIGAAWINEANRFWRCRQNIGLG